ncbi:MAG: DUF2061 domain-containing protein [Bacteroidales bacterium]|nr:DUF2061 domain-containing protein [Bacteroidales bacterium]
MNESDTDNKESHHIKVSTEVKESPSRSLVKALSYRILATFGTFLISFIVFHNYTEKTLYEISGISAIIAVSEFFLKIFFYYIHERLWANIRWGKYWKRKYWRGRAWKKLYRKMHQQHNSSNS